MEEYIKNWMESVDANVKDACLEALTVLALRNTTEEYKRKALEINNTLKKCCPNNNPYLQKLVSIYKVLYRWEVANKPQANFKKWWE